MKPVAVLLRAVNAGRPLVMADLRKALARLGYPDAVTVLASGNAVIRAKAADALLEAELEAGLREALGQPVDAFVRDGNQLAEIVARNPFPEMSKTDPSHLVVGFAKGRPEPELVEALRGKIVGREEVAAGPSCVYVTYPDGIGRSKLTGAIIEKTLKTGGTARNWNTVLKLAALTAQD